jgi:anti-sigma factor RsiW
MTTSRHCSAEELQELLDGRLPELLVRAAREHLETCPGCSEAFRSLSALDRNLRRVPLERTGAAFTATLMNELRLVPSRGGNGRMFEMFALSVGLFLVLAVITIAFIWAGVIPVGGTEGDAVVQTVVAKGNSAMNDGAKTLAGWLAPVTQLMPKSGVTHLILFALPVIGVLAVIDRLVGRRILSRS